MSLLSCRQLVRRPWIEGKNLALERGETVVLSGPSGSGKSLFLRALADLDPVDGGEIRLNGELRERLDGPSWRRRVCYVSSRLPRFPGTVGAHLAGVRELLESNAGAPADLPSLAPGLAVDRLSNGEAQLLALHRAFLASPTVLLLDEGTSHLDPERARAVEGSLREWVTDGEHALLWVSHDEGLAARMGARQEHLG